MQLVATTGPLAGTALKVDDGATITDPSARGAGSRPCCRFRASGSGFVLQVLQRETPVFVNGLAVSTRVLEPRDELRIGDSLFIARDDELVHSPLIARCRVQLKRPGAARRIATLAFDDVLLANKHLAISREARDLSALLRVDAALSAVHGLAHIDAAVAGFVLDVVPAERVLLTGDDRNPAAVGSAWSSQPSGATPLHIDPALLEDAINGRVAVAAEMGEGQAIVAPMMVFGRVTGCIWAETSRADPFDEGHVRLLLVVAALTAVMREQAREAARLQRTNEALQAEISLEHNMVGRSKPMRLLFERIARVARTEATVLICGESGTGKELVARAVHRNSGRANRPFVAIDCAAITETLLESEFFGHEKGAFTGAMALKQGKLELSDGGTLFLDEIGELPLALQAKLLRAIQEREFARVGGTRAVRVDFRLIAATNRDLEAAVKEGSFRQDLFYRLNVATLALPALRDRKEDIPPLAGYFVRKHAVRCRRPVINLAAETLERLASHEWPGNVRELENVIEQALALGAGDQITVDDLPPSVGDRSMSPVASRTLRPAASLDYHRSVQHTKRDLIVRALEEADHSYKEAARLLNIHPNYLHRLIRTLELKPHLGRPRGG
jgi:transcriptional regulator with GAF, ATPase, and Fis domain